MDSTEQPAFASELPHLKSAFATASNSTHRKGEFGHVQQDYNSPFSTSLKKQQAVDVAKREADFR